MERVKNGIVPPMAYFIRKEKTRRNMSEEIKPLGLLYMWLLVTRGGEALLKDIRPECKPEHRRPLLAGGLIEETPAGRSKKLTLTDAGWHYLSTHMTDSINARAVVTTANVLQGVLGTVHAYMQGADVNLAEIFSPKLKIDFNADTFWNRLLRSWRRLRETDDGIRLEKLRPAFGDVPRARLDSVLLELQKQGKIVIYPYDDGERVTPEVREAALRVNGRELHIIYQK